MVGGIDWLVMYSPECAGVGGKRPAKCADNGLSGEQWARRISDQSSGSSGAAAFDFNGDGAFEVVYRDECWLRAFDGKTGRALFAVPASSATGVETPTIADVDGDGHAEIIVSSTAFPQCKAKDDPETGARWTGLTNGVLVLSDPLKQWMPARPLWNQHSYHVTNILDDLSVPAHEAAGWRSWNAYRQNEQGIDGRAYGIGDFTAGPASAPSNVPMACATRWTLYAELCNRGAGTVQKGVPGAFYRSDPRLAVDGGAPAPLCVAQTRGTLPPGACETVSCDWASPSTFTTDLWFRADDDGHSAPREECNPENNLLILRGAHCNILN